MQTSSANAHSPGLSLYKDKRMIWTVKRGRHKFWPSKGLGLPKVRQRPTIFYYNVNLSESAIYLLDGNDQLDWNKGAGVSFNLFTNHKNSWMWAWRYNPETNKFEVTYYIHDGNEIYKGDTEFVEVDPGQDFVVMMSKHDNTYHCAIQVGNIIKHLCVKYKGKHKRLGREINPWFGGNRKAPNKISFYMKKHIA